MWEAVSCTVNSFSEGSVLPWARRRLSSAPCRLSGLSFPPTVSTLCVRRIMPPFEHIPVRVTHPQLRGSRDIALQCPLTKYFSHGLKWPSSVGVLFRANLASVLRGVKQTYECFGKSPYCNSLTLGGWERRGRGTVFCMKKSAGLSNWRESDNIAF